jgi:hypothetical protein
MGGQGFSQLGTAIDRNENVLYHSHLNNNQIVMLNLDFNVLSSVGTTGTGDNQFNSPYDLNFRQNSLYICDFNNERVQTYSKHLKFIESYKLDYKPWKIKTSCSIILIASEPGPDLYFYNLHNFILKKKFKGRNNVKWIRNKLFN